MIESLGMANYLPLKTESRQWNDRKQKVTIPIFSGYLFVRIHLLDGSKLRVLKVPGVVGFVGNSNGPLPIPDQQIETVRAIVAQGKEYTVHSLLKEGSLVRVMRGALAGVEGRLIRFNSASRLVISIDMIHCSLSVSISPDDVEPVHSCAT